MNSCPLSVRPGAEINHRVAFVGIELPANWQCAVQLRDHRLKRLFKVLEVFFNLHGWRAEVGADLYTGFFQARFPTESADVSCLSVQALHQAHLPIGGQFYGRSFAQVRAVDNFLENTCEIPSELGTIRVPVRHPEPLALCFGLARLTSR